ncbi:hypothetical protein [Flavobacterium caseinilyticum]|uniref:TIR domain-containing protein n=1 Tax=Flavobacterium caseinilyticum TaxID=2541732 RepID=A0A4R5B0N4_9FLAO|nr:hypothetical protein [Flavobacterium caseinilyticum]TDD78635.1 hypothetical protein E0F89_03090 [Flavobacterium caseinilyticum]
MQISVLFDKAAFVILVTPEFEDYNYLEIGDKLSEIRIPFFQTDLPAETGIISNNYRLIPFSELRSRIGNNPLNLMENLKHHHSPSCQKQEKVKGDILNILSIYLF